MAYCAGSKITARCVFRAVAAALLSVAVCAPAQAATDLLEVFEQARGSDPEYLSAVAAIDVADARYRQARAALWPHLSGNASAGKIKQKQTFEGAPSGFSFGGGGGGDADFEDTQTLNLQLNQTLFDWTAWQQKDAAAARSAAAKAQWRAAAQDLMVRSAQAYFDVLAGVDALAAARRQKAVIARQLDRADAAFQAGLAPVTNKQEAQSALDAARVDAITARNQLARARAALARITGVAPVDLAVLTEPEAARAPVLDLDAWLARALATSPAVAAADRAYDAAKQEVAAARGGRFPDIDLVGRVGKSERTVNFPIPGVGNTEFNSITETQSIGIELTLPLFLGGATSAAVDEAVALASQAQQDLIAARRRVMFETRAAYDDVQASAARVEALEAAIRSAKTAVAAAKAGLRTGTRNILDVLEAEIELVQRRARYKQAWYDYFTARLRLAQAAGSLAPPDLARVNAQLVERAGPPALLPKTAFGPTSGG